MGVIGLHDLAYESGALPITLVRTQAGIEGRIKDPADNGFQPVAHVRKRTRHDDRHRVLEEGGLDLFLDRDVFDTGNAAAPVAGQLVLERFLSHQSSLRYPRTGCLWRSSG